MAHVHYYLMNRRKVLIIGHSGYADQLLSYLREDLTNVDLSSVEYDGSGESLTGIERQHCIIFEVSQTIDLTDLEVVTTNFPESPIVVLHDNARLNQSELLSKGATDIVYIDDWNDAIYGLIGTRIERYLDHQPVDESASRTTALKLLLEEKETLFCIFDNSLEHVFVGGGLPAKELDPTSFEGTHIEDALSRFPQTAVHLAANYTAALKEETRSREVAIGDGTYSVTTGPLETDHEGSHGYAEFSPVYESHPKYLAEMRDKLAQLHETVSDLGGATSEEQIFEHAIDCCERLFSSDACILATAEDGVFTPAAATDSTIDVGRDRLNIDEGIAGETYASGETQISSLQSDEGRSRLASNRFESVLSVAIDDYGVFQALSADSDAFSESDKEIAELLISYVVHALDRIRYQAAITEERDRFAALFQNIPDGVARYVAEERSTRIEAVNSAFVRLLGHEPSEVVGTSVFDLLNVEGDTEVIENLTASVSEGEHLDTEVVHQTERGSKPFLLRNIPFDSSGNHRHGYLIYTDISKLKEKEHALRQKNERLDEFAGIVSHDLRNPLSIAQGYYDLAVDNQDVNYLEPLGRALDRMEQMIDELLTLAQEGHVIDDLNSIDLASVAEEAWEYVTTHDAELNITGSKELLADRDRLQELFENLYRNAVEHVGEDVTVTVGTTKRGFYIADDGPGIPDEYKDQVFEHGFSMSTDGTGYGLAIVSDIAGAHGWSAEITDSEGGGARFEFAGESESGSDGAE